MIVNNCLNIKFEEAHDIDTGNRTWDWAPLAQLHLTPAPDHRLWLLRPLSACINLSPVSWCDSGLVGPSLAVIVPVLSRGSAINLQDKNKICLCGWNWELTPLPGDGPPPCTKDPDNDSVEASKTFYSQASYWVKVHSFLNLDYRSLQESAWLKYILQDDESAQMSK